MTTKSATVLFRCAGGEEVEASRPVVESSCRVLAGMLGDTCVDDSESPTFDVSDFGKDTVEAFLSIASMMSFDGKGAADFAMDKVLRRSDESLCDGASSWHIDLAIRVVMFAGKYEADGVLCFLRLTVSAWSSTGTKLDVSSHRIARKEVMGGRGYFLARLAMAVIEANGDASWVPVRIAVLLVRSMVGPVRFVSVDEVPVGVREALFRTVLTKASLRDGDTYGQTALCLLEL
tara:strand:- start:21 stop:719 length:699 start_codon:yes stop_codon:yes gene_type:complete